MGLLSRLAFVHHPLTHSPTSQRKVCKGENLQRSGEWFIELAYSLGKTIGSVLLEDSLKNEVPGLSAIFGGHNKNTSLCFN